MLGQYDRTHGIRLWIGKIDLLSYFKTVELNIKGRRCFSDEHDMFKSQSTDSQIVFITLILVLVLAVPTIRSITTNGTESGQPEQKIKANVSVGRFPSSVSTEANVNVSSALREFAHYDLSCDKKGLSKKFKQTVAGHVIQLRGKICTPNLKESEIEIINNSNGFTASTFGNGSNKYLTDFIQLQKGDNEIVIRYRESSGKNVEEVIHILSTQI